MLPTLRRSQILAAARQRGGVSVRELSRRLNVSAPTIRRDLSALADRGLVARVHGGALPVGTAPAAAWVPEIPAAPAPVEAVVPARAGDLARAAALVVPGMAVGVSAGPTALRLAGLLRAIAAVTVVTPAPAVADALRDNGTVVVVIGGVRTAGGSHAGPVALLALRRLNLDIAFVEVRARAGAGYATADPAAVETDRALLRCAARRVLLAAPETGLPPVLAGFPVQDPADLLLR